MHVVRSMALFNGYETPAELLERLWSMAPAGRCRPSPGAKDGFKLETPEGDPLFDRVVQLLREHGYEAGVEHNLRAKRYRVVRKRVYDAGDVGAAPLFWLEGCEDWGNDDGPRLEDGRMRVRAKDLGSWGGRPTKIADALVVPGRVREALEAAGYVGLVLRPVAPTVPTRAKRKAGEPPPTSEPPGTPVEARSAKEEWWELTGTATLGPMRRVERRALSAGMELLPEGTRGPGHLLSEGFLDFRPVYLASVVNAARGHDIVHTWEYRFRESAPGMLVSRRLAEALTGFQPTCRWAPIEVIGD